LTLRYPVFKFWNVNSVPRVGDSREAHGAARRSLKVDSVLFQYLTHTFSSESNLSAIRRPMRIYAKVFVHLPIIRCAASP
ncbi:MAG: hypothetical protein K2Z81_05570, partial [Cyanobacteria bacterium]|nr:hypothetical protein [Cyanobacteriota bacterium]